MEGVIIKTDVSCVVYYYTLKTDTIDYGDCIVSRPTRVEKSYPILLNQIDKVKNGNNVKFDTTISNGVEYAKITAIINSI